MTRPTRVVRMSRLTDRQRSILALDGTYALDGKITISLVGRLLGYRAPGAALARLHRRGLLQRVAPGVYRVARVGERRVFIPPPRDAAEWPSVRSRGGDAA